MTPKQQLKNLIEQLPDEKGALIETLVKNLLKDNQLKPPRGKLGIKKPFDRKAFYDDIVADRY
jgi:hypothetical protein